ncbi:hypothetical protein [Microbacterium sp. NPDC096154]|uniref:hypothetical protein n=1 Tax=Microbacterium sp. NPDC096154 TaxID=3155549 RepID=UPI00332EA65A
MRETPWPSTTAELARQEGVYAVVVKRRAGQISSVRRGWHIDTEGWTRLYGEERHLARVRAAWASSRLKRGVVGYASAAVLHGLPLYGVDLERVHLVLPPSRRASSNAVVRRHIEELPDEDLIEVDGIVATTLERTVFDVARTARAECALVVADAALRAVAWEEGARAYDLGVAAEWRSRMLRKVESARGVRGVLAARRAIEFADGRAQLPGESVTRLRLRECGWRHFVLQAPVRGGSGREFFVDVGVEEIRTWVEFDGVDKYIAPSMTGGREVGAVLAAERERQAEIVAATGWPLVRVGWPHIDSRGAFARRLREQGVVPPAH